MDRFVPRDDAKRRGCEAMKRRFSPLCRVWERQRLTGVGARARRRHDMAARAFIKRESRREGSPSRRLLSLRIGRVL